MLSEVTLLGKQDKVQTAIEFLKTYEPMAIDNNEEGYYVAYSGGKDSIVIAYLCILAGVKFALHNQHTTVDPPELVYFIRDMKKWYKQNFNVELYIHYPGTSMFKLIPEKVMPPTRMVRYCCDVLKEGGGEGRFVITGVRWAESKRRKNTRALIETNAYTKKIVKLNNDNDEARRQVESCEMKGKHIFNPIISWSDEDVWEFIHKYNIPYCELYDKGWDRLGCIGCPLANDKHMAWELEQYPKYRDNYLRAFKRMIENNKARGKKRFINETPEEVMYWWIHGNLRDKPCVGQETYFEDIDADGE